MAGFLGFIGELNRRGVFKAGGIYLAGGWLLLQVLDVIIQPVGLSDWLIRLSMWLLVVGFPFTLAFSWRYDIGLGGLSRTPSAETIDPKELAISKGDFAGLAISILLVGVLAIYLARTLRDQQAEIIADAGAGSIAENSIAVLPFKNLGGDTESYLGQGLAEDILHRLASIPGLPVASRTAAFELETANLDMADIGRRLGVRNLLEGSVRRDGERVRIVAQLIDVETGYHLWSSRYDRRIEDLFRIYDEISQAVTSELQLTLAPETELIRPPPTVDMEAYDYFLQARSMLQRATTADNVANAQRFFANAVDRDPDFAEAWAGQCRAFLEWQIFEAAPERIDAAEQSCQKALELNPELADGRVGLGDLYRSTGAYEMAVVEYRKALQYEPRLAIAWRGLGLALDGLGRESEANGALVKAIEHDPDDLLSLLALGDFHYDRGRFSEAAVYYRRMAEHPRSGVNAFTALGAALMMNGDLEESVEAFRQVIALEPSAVAYSNIGVIYYTLGRYEDSVVMNREAIGMAPDDPYTWSNLGDSLLQTGADEERVREAYEQAAELARALSEVNPRDVGLLTTLAHCHARLGDDAMARGYIEIAQHDAPGDPYVFYYASLVHLEAGRADEALADINRSVELNYPVDQLSSDPQFEELREREEFKALLSGSAGADISDQTEK